MRHTVTELEAKAYQYRVRFLELFTTIGFGHLTSAFSWTEIATVLYNEIMRLPPEGMDMTDCDKMVVSKGHGAGMLFPIFEDLGYFSKEEMTDTVRIGGKQEKLRKLYYPGFDFYGGSLGIGIGLACGLALGAKQKGASWKVYCLVGDAECYEGAVWEAMNFAGHRKLGNLIVIVDRNQLGCSDFTEHMLRLEPFADKWLSCGWSVSESDGHDISQLYGTLSTASQAENDKPKCIIAHTKKGYGLDYLVDKPLMHGYMPQGEEAARAFDYLREGRRRNSIDRTEAAYLPNGTANMNEGSSAADMPAAETDKSVGGGNSKHSSVIYILYVCVTAALIRKVGRQ